MVRKSFFGMGIGLLLLIALTVLGSVLVYQTGWSRGYATGIVTAGVQDGTLTPASPIYPGAASMSNGPMWGLVVFMVIGLGFLALAFTGRMARMRIWSHMAGHWGAQEPPSGRWEAHRKGQHGPMWPWCWYAAYEEACEEKARESGPTGQAENAGK